MKTVAAGKPTQIAVSSPSHGKVVLSGTIAADSDPVVNTYAFSDPARYARTAFIEALQRAGVTVTANSTTTNPAKLLPSKSAVTGLRMGQALVFPGRQSRLLSLQRAGDTAGVVALGSVAMFLVAGLIEGIFRQTVGEPAVRWSVAGGTFLLWSAYFLFAGRRP